MYIIALSGLYLAHRLWRCGLKCDECLSLSELLLPYVGFLSTALTVCLVWWCWMNRHVMCPSSREDVVAGSLECVDRSTKQDKTTKTTMLDALRVSRNSILWIH